MTGVERDVRAGWRLAERCGRHSPSQTPDCQSAHAEYEAALGRYRSELPRPSDRTVHQLQTAEALLRSALAAHYEEPVAPARPPNERMSPPSAVLPKASLLRLAGIVVALLSLGGCGLLGDDDPVSPYAVHRPSGALKEARLQTGPLAVGQYRIICDGLGRPQTIVLVAG